jgi:hypothetical protein
VTARPLTGGLAAKWCRETPAGVMFALQPVPDADPLRVVVPANRRGWLTPATGPNDRVVCTVRVAYATVPHDGPARITISGPTDRPDHIMVAANWAADDEDLPDSLRLALVACIDLAADLGGDAA